MFYHCANAFLVQLSGLGLDQFKKYDPKVSESSKPLETGEITLPTQSLRKISMFFFNDAHNDHRVTFSWSKLKPNSWLLPTPKQNCIFFMNFLAFKAAFWPNGMEMTLILFFGASPQSERIWIVNNVPHRPPNAPTSSANQTVPANTQLICLTSIYLFYSRMTRYFDTKNLQNYTLKFWKFFKCKTRKKNKKLNSHFQSYWFVMSLESRAWDSRVALLVWVLFFGKLTENFFCLALLTLSRLRKTLHPTTKLEYKFGNAKLSRDP